MNTDLNNISLASISDSAIEETNTTRDAKNRLKKDLNNLGSISQFHGLNRILTRNTLFRSIWLTFFLASLGLCIYTVVTNIQQYLSYGVNTLVQVVPENTVTFPTVSVCNQNPFISRVANKYIEDYYLNTYNVTLNTYENFNRLIFNKQVPNDIDWLFYRTFDPEFNRTLRASFGLSFEEENVFCRWIFSSCNRNKYRNIYHPKYGSCFVFNSGQQNNGSNTDILRINAEEYGLEMGVFTGEAKNPKYFYNGKIDNGIVIMIGDQNSTSLDQEGILVKPGLWANIVLSKSSSKNLPQPYNDCQNLNSVNTLLGNEINRLNISYDRHNCFTLCKQMIVIEKLGCYDMRYPNLLNSSPCSDKSSFERLKTIELDLNRCQNECPFECESTILDWDISYASFPNKYIFKIINATNYKSLRRLYTNQSFTYSDVQQAVAGFFIYYGPLSITVISQSVAITLADLFANIGGALGLFIGISLLSLVELLEMSIISIETLLKIKFPTWFNKSKPKIEPKKTTRMKHFGLLADIRKELKRSGDLTTLHGVPNILLTDRTYMKIIWVLFFLLSMGLCIFMIVRAITNFQTKSQIRQVPQQSITFPSIQICNPNYFATREASAFLNEYYLKNYRVNITNLDEYFAYQNSSSFGSFNWPFYKTFSPEFNDTLRRSLGYSLEDMILKCEFDSKPCNLSWFDWYYHPINGNCYRFNTGILNRVQNEVDLLSVNKPNTGLYMELFTGLPDDYYDFYFRQWEYNSINLYISPQGHLPIDKYARPFKPGTAASIKLYLTHSTDLPTPYSNCQYTQNMNSDLVKSIRKANISYDRYNCIAFCQQQILYNVTSCYYMTYPNIFNLSLCESYDQCKRNREADLDDAECPILCPPECEQYEFDYDVSLSEFPSRSYSHKLIRNRSDSFKRLFQTDNITYDMVKKSVASFYFYFDELVITEIEQSPSIEFVDLISNIGGIFGLFVGLSVLSFVEIIELSISLVKIFTRYM